MSSVVVSGLTLPDMKILLALSRGPLRACDVFAGRGIGHTTWRYRRYHLIEKGLVQYKTLKHLGRTRVVQEKLYWLSPRGKKIADLLESISRELSS